MKDDLIPLRDILKEIEFLHSVRDRTTFESFKASSSDVRAASYSIMVISEAVRRIPAEWLDEQPATPWHAIRTIGNKLRHEYQRIWTSPVSVESVSAGPPRARCRCPIGC